jgi:hypothetical protein
VAVMARLFIGKGLVAWAIIAGIAHNSDAVDMTATCVEDMACWDCSTMGNGICGGLT